LQSRGKVTRQQDFTSSGERRPEARVSYLADRDSEIGLHPEKKRDDAREKGMGGPPPYKKKPSDKKKL